VFGAAAATRGYAFFDRYGRKLGDATTRGADNGGRLSRDGLRAVIAEIDPEKASTDIYIIDLATGARSRVTSDPGWDQSAVWSPTGDRVAYRLGSTVYVQQVSGGNRTRVGDFGRGTEGFVHDWSADGKYLLISRSAINGGELGRMTLADGRIESIGPSSATEGGDARLSTDGRWVVYLSAETGSTEVHVRSFPDGRVTKRITTTGGDAPLWNNNGTELFYLDGEGWVAACRIRTAGSTVETGVCERLFKPNVANSWGAGYQHDIDAKGRFFVYRVGDDAGSFANSLTVMLNWTKALRK
jgi:Tol biopolymer transport system component